MPKIVPRDNPCYCINFRRAANTLTKFYDRAFVSIGLTTNQFSLLNDVKLIQPCNKSNLAQFSRLDRTTIIRSLSVLREKGLVEEAKRTDARSKAICLTEAGETAISEGMAGWKQAQKRIRALWGPENVQVLKQIFVDIETLDEDE